MTATDQGQGSTGGGGARALTAGAIAQLVQGTLAGDASTIVSAIAPLDRAQPHELSFLASRKYLAVLAASRAGVVLVPTDLDPVGAPTAARITVGKPHDALLTLIPHLYPDAGMPARGGIHPTAQIGRGATLGRDVSLGANVVVGAGAVVGDRVVVEANAVIGDGVRIGNDSVLWPGVALYRGTDVGARVLLHSGVRIGSDGFGYVFRDGSHAKIPHIGRCRIEDDVEIGANTTIDRGSIDDTVIGAGT